MLKKMEAQIIFGNANDVNAGLAALIDHDCDVRILPNLIDPYSSAVWVRAVTITELGESCFFDWLQAVVDPLDGMVLEAGLAGPPAIWA